MNRNNFRCGTVIPKGTKIYAWEIIGDPISDKNGYGLRFPCKCLCGKEKNILGKTLRDGESKSCGCRSDCASGGWIAPIETCNYCSKKFKSIRAIVLHIKKCHLKNNQKYCSKCKLIKDLCNFTSQDNLCKICRKLNCKEHYNPSDLRRRYNQAVSKGTRRGRQWKITYEEYIGLLVNQCHYCGGEINLTGVGLDRMNNTKDYVLGNVVPCCKRCNIVKSDFFSYEEMLKLSKVITEIDVNRRK